MAWGTGTTVEDAEVYGGPAEGYSGFEGGGPVAEESFEEGSQTLNQQRLTDKFSFYLDDDQFGFKFSDSPFSAQVGVGQGGRTNWGAQVGGSSRLFGKPTDKTGLLNANLGIAGQGTSGSVSPWGNLSTSPIPGLTFSVGAQKNPGMNFNLVGPSVSYGQQFKTPIGPLDFNLDKSYGGPWSGSLRYQKDW